MVAHCRFVSVYDAAGMADYFMRETQPRHERDMDREAMRLPDPGEHEGTVPELRRDISDNAAQAFRLIPGQTPSYDEAYNLIRGARADGEPTGKRITADYERSDGREFKQKHFIEVRMSWDTSISMTVANAETQHGRALVMSSLNDAAHWTMKQYAEKMGIARVGAGGRGGEVKGDIAWMAFAHHTTRPDKSGNVWPHYHIHFVVPNGVVLPDQKIRAIHMKKVLGFDGELSRSLQDMTASNFKRIGLEFRRNDDKPGNVIATGIPDDVRKQFISRSVEMQDYAKRKAGLDDAAWQALPARDRDRLMDRARNFTQGAAVDGMANRPAWRRKLHAAGVAPANPRGIAPLARSAEATMQQMAGLVTDLSRLSMPDRAERLRQDMARTHQVVRMQREQAKLHHPTIGPSVARAAGLARALVPVLVMRAHRLRYQAETLRRSPEMILKAGLHMQRQAVMQQVASLAETMKRIPMEGRTMAKEVTGERIPVGPQDRVHVDNAAGRYQVAVTFAAKAGDTSSDAERTVYHAMTFKERAPADALALRVIEAGGITRERWQAQAYDATPRQAPDADERLVRVYARKVAAGEIPLSQAVDTMARREESRAEPISRNPVHQTATYAPGAATADNRDQREAKWQDRIGNAVEKIHAGTAWADTQKAPTQNAPTPRMRMER